MEKQGSINENMVEYKQECMIGKRNDRIKELYREIEELKSEISNLYLEKQKIARAKYINLGESFNIIAYLVSKIEDEDYIVDTLSVKLYCKQSYYHDLLSRPEGVDYVIAYLVKKDEREKARKEISEKFKINPSDATLSKDDFYANHKYLGIKSENYIQLAYYKPLDWPVIYYSSDNVIDVDKGKKSEIQSMICDEDYDYIVDFMNKVVSFRLSNPDFEIPFWEMKSLADSYANSFKNAKTKIRKP